MNIPLTPALMVAKQQTEAFYRALGADDARQGHAPRSLPGIDPCWTEIYIQSDRQTLTQQQATETEDRDIPF